MDAQTYAAKLPFLKGDCLYAIEGSCGSSDAGYWQEGKREKPDVQGEVLALVWQQRKPTHARETDSARNIKYLILALGVHLTPRSLGEEQESLAKSHPRDPTCLLVILWGSLLE